MKVADFKVGDRVKFISEGYDRFGQEAVVVGFYNSCGDEFLSVVFDNQTTLQTSDWYPYRFEIISKAEHPNQKLANEVAEILRNTADFYLMQPNGQQAAPSSDNPAGWGNFYSCCAARDCAMDKKWSDSKIKRVIERFLRSLGVETESMDQFPGYWNTPQRQETRHAWLYIAAQFAEENPDLVPTYGKKKASV